MLVDDDVLIDAGTGIGDLPLEDLRSIRHVFLTHAHLDHIAGLPMLVDCIFSENIDTPVTVYAREETIKAIQDHLFNWVIWPDFGKPKRGYSGSWNLPSVLQATQTSSRIACFLPHWHERASPHRGTVASCNTTPRRRNQWHIVDKC